VSRSVPVPVRVPVPVPVPEKRASVAKPGLA